jgi:hypothetical protein
MVSVFFGAAVALLALAGYLLYVRLHKPLADPDYFLPMLTPSGSLKALDKPVEQGGEARQPRQIRNLDLEQIRSAGL